VLAVRTCRTRGVEYESSQTLPGFHAHALEALVEIASFLSTRFPDLFKVRRTTYVAEKPETHGDSISGREAGAIVAVENVVTGEKWDFAEIEARNGAEWNPMAVAGCACPIALSCDDDSDVASLPVLLQDDLAVMVEREDGHYVFQAGSFCTAGSSSSLLSPSR
jgi:hypothetical protein